MKAKKPAPTTVRAWEVLTHDGGPTRSVDAALTIDAALDLANALTPQGSIFGIRIPKAVADRMRAGDSYRVAQAKFREVEARAQAAQAAKAARSSAQSSTPTAVELDIVTLGNGASVGIAR